MTASTIGSPTLPQAIERSPALRSIASSICTVVVLPLVPVTASHGARVARGPAAARRARPRPRPGPRARPPGRAAARRGASPGEVTSDVDVVGQGGGGPGAEPDGRAEDLQQRGLLAAVALGGLVERGDATRRGGSGCRRRRSRRRPCPATTARTPSQESRRPSASRSAVCSCARHPLGVEDAEPGRDARAR